jgi:hypothetical protein
MDGNEHGTSWIYPRITKNSNEIQINAGHYEHE